MHCLKLCRLNLDLFKASLEFIPKHHDGRGIIYSDGGLLYFYPCLLEKESPPLALLFIQNEMKPH